MIIKIVFLALLAYCASISQAQDSLPIPYRVHELQGDGDTCPNDQLRQETLDTISHEVRTMAENIVIPLLDPNRQCPCMTDKFRLAFLNMTDTSQQCPDNWTLVTSPHRSCGRTISGTYSCSSVTFPANGISYTHVCGRVRAYHSSITYAFFYNYVGIDSSYVDGVSITHGNPRQHVWTFASAYNENYSGSGPYICRCSNNASTYAADFSVPSFVGDDYFCDTSREISGYDSEDPLWDGEGCGPTSTCCEFNNPPWFCTTLPQPTTDDLEIRICGTNTNSDNPVELIEIYVD